MSVRGFTYGYDYYAPSQNVAFHIYAIRENKDKRNQVSNFNENEILFPGAKKDAYRRLNGIIDGDDGGATTTYNTIEEDRYGLGKVRSPTKFYNTFGINNEEHTIEESLCDFVQGTGGITSMHATFMPQLRYDSMGIDYNRISYEHKEIVRQETNVDEKELVMLREQLRKRKGQQD